MREWGDCASYQHRLIPASALHLLSLRRLIVPISSGQSYCLCSPRSISERLGRTSTAARRCESSALRGSTLCCLSCGLSSRRMNVERVSKAWGVFSKGQLWRLVFLLSLLRLSACLSERSLVCDAGHRAKFTDAMVKCMTFVMGKLGAKGVFHNTLLFSGRFLVRFSSTGHRLTSRHLHSSGYPISENNSSLSCNLLAALSCALHELVWSIQRSHLRLSPSIRNTWSLCALMTPASTPLDLRAFRQSSPRRKNATLSCSPPEIGCVDGSRTTRNFSRLSTEPTTVNSRFTWPPPLRISKLSTSHCQRQSCSALPDTPIWPRSLRRNATRTSSVRSMPSRHHRLPSPSRLPRRPDSRVARNRLCLRPRTDVSSRFSRPL